MREGCLRACGIFVAIAAFQAMARAGVPSAERLRTAAEEFDSGRRAYQLKDFESAAVHFENADRDSPSADALFAAIRSRYEAGQLARAATLASSGLTRYPQDKTITNYAGRILPEADARLYKAVVKCTPECTLVLDGKLVPVALSTNVTLYLDAGAHTVIAGWSGDRHIRNNVAAIAGASTELDLVAPPKSSPIEGSLAAQVPDGRDEAAEPNARDGADGHAASGLPPTFFWVGAGLTVALGGIAIWSGIDTIQNPGTEAVRAACDAHAPNCQSLFDEGKAHEARTNGLLLGTAAVGIGTGIVGLLFTDWRGTQKKAESVNTLTPLLTLGSGLTVGARGRF